ncbi:Uncharacterised protein [Vibrio cholerae]|nr:Uncharacterised protein [Vibrio cholerae]
MACGVHIHFFVSNAFTLKLLFIFTGRSDR